MRKFKMASSAIHNGRIIRFLMVIGAVVLTIFIYAFYYSNPIITHRLSSPALLYAPPAPHSSSSFRISLKNSNLNSISQTYDNIVDENVNIVKNSNNNNNNNNDIISNNSISSLGISNIGNSISNLTTTTTNTSTQLLPTVMRQEPAQPQQLIEIDSGGADKYLQKIYFSGLNLVTTSTTTSSQKTSSFQPQSPSQAAGNAVIGRISPPSVTRVQKPSDPSSGIPTSYIYEGGHLDFNPQLCLNDVGSVDTAITTTTTNNDIRLFIFITSAPAHFEARLAIRQTWGHYGNRRDVSIGFLLGRSGNKTLEESLNDENYMYGDLIRGNFLDSYNNLTLKTISMLEWIDTNCPTNIKFVLKTDDDMFINVPKLLQFIDKHQNDKRVIFGRLAKKWKPIRNKKSKYYVAPNQFSANIFPQFTTGPAYLLSADVVHDLYTKCLEQTYLKLEDVFTTGIVAQKLNIKRVHVNDFLNRRISFNPCNIRKAISVHMIKPTEQFDLWKKLLDQTKCK